MSDPREHGEGEEEEEGEEEWESEDSWESDLDSEAEIAELMQMDLVEDSASTGKQEYLAKCSELQIVPVAMFIAKLECEHINLRHHGMGVKGARALAAALLANVKIRSLNLGDNWFGDEGVHAVAEVTCLFSAPPHRPPRPATRSHHLPCSRHAVRLPPHEARPPGGLYGRSWPPTRRSPRSTFRITILACPGLRSCAAGCRHAASPPCLLSCLRATRTPP